jgi:hypothetical protein
MSYLALEVDSLGAVASQHVICSGKESNIQYPHWVTAIINLQNICGHIKNIGETFKMGCKECGGVPSVKVFLSLSVLMNHLHSDRRSC